MAARASIEVRIADLPVFQRLLDFIAEYAYHTRDCAAIDADGEWRVGNPECSCGYTQAVESLTGKHGDG